MLKKSALLAVSAILLTCGTPPLSAAAARSPESEPALETRPLLNCQPMGDLLMGRSYRGYEFRRDGKNLNYTFRYRLEDDDLGVTRWLLVPLHPTNQAKRGDSQFTLGTSCFSYKDGYSYSYNPKSVRAIEVSRHSNGFPKYWNFDGRLLRVRDEVDSLALIGLNAQGNRVVFHIRYSETGPRRGGTILGKLNGLACRVSVVGLPIAQGIYVVSRKSLEALSLLEVPGADKANLTLEGFSIYAGVDSNGRVKGRFGIRFDGSASDREKILEYGELAVTTMLEELNGELIDDIAMSSPRSARNIKEGLFFVDAELYLDDWMSAIDALEETVSETDLDLCKYWD